MLRVLKEREYYVFQHPFRAFVPGHSCCGKTELTKNILQNLNTLVDKQIDRIVLCYNEWQDKYEILKYMERPIEFVQGTININDFDNSINNLIILDDLMSKCKESSDILDLFTIKSHHRNISVFLVTQNIFIKGKWTRDLNLNSSYMIIFRNIRDVTQISTLARQMFPGKTKDFLRVFDDATSADDDHGYVFLDLNPGVSQDLRIQGNIIEKPDRPRIVYVLD